MKRARLWFTVTLTLAGLAAGLWAIVAGGSLARAADPPRGPVLHYSFDPPLTPGAVADRSGKDHDGQATGVRFIAAGKVGGACAFAPADSTIDVTGGAAASTKQATFAFWIKTSYSDTTRARILGARSGSAYTLDIGGGALGASVKGKLGFTLNGRTCLSDLPITDGKWHHAAVTFDGDYMRMYIDGQPQNQVVLNRTEIPALLSGLAINVSRNGTTPQEKTQGFEGVLDELMIFDRSLPMEEVRGLVSAVDPAALKPRYTRQQVTVRLRELKMLFEDGLLTEEFYAKKVAECEAGK